MIILYNTIASLLSLCLKGFYALHPIPGEDTFRKTFPQVFIPIFDPGKRHRKTIIILYNTKTPLNITIYKDLGFPGEDKNSKNTQNCLKKDHYHFV